MKMRKWKTTQRRIKKLPNSESGGNLSEHSYDEPASDSSSLSFLDDMLGTATSRPQARQRVRSDNGARSPPPPQMKVGDIDDILDLVSGPEVERRRDSSSSGLSSRSNRGPEPREPEPTSSYESYSKRSSMRTLGRYGSGGSVGPGSRDHSPASFRNESDRTFYRSGRGPHTPPPGNPGRRNPGSIESSQDPFVRPNSLSTTVRSERHPTSDAAADDDVDDDNLMPIPVFHVDADDDDTISCITTSVSSHYDIESRSGSFPWSRRSQKAASIGEHSYADTLDEIADMLHPNQNGRSSGLGHRGGGSAKAPIANKEFFRPPTPKQLTSVDDVFGSNPHFAQSDAPSLNAGEIYRGTKAPKGRSQHSWTFGEPFLSQTRLLFRYWISRILPQHWRKKGVKDDDGQGYLGTWQSGSDPKGLSPSKHRRASWKYFPHSVGRLVVVLMVAILLVHFATLHGTKMKSTAMARLRSLSKKHAVKPPIGKDVHGGMAKRSHDSAVGGKFGGSVAGGMAHHSVTDINTAPKKHGNSQHDHAGVKIPPAFNVLADVTDLPVRKGVDAPLYWHIPRSGGGTVNDIFGGCLSLTLASDAGGSAAAGMADVSTWILSQFLVSFRSVAHIAFHCRSSR